MAQHLHQHLPSQHHAPPTPFSAPHQLSAHQPASIRAQGAGAALVANRCSRVPLSSQTQMQPLMVVCKRQYRMQVKLSFMQQLQTVNLGMSADQGLIIALMGREALAHAVRPARPDAISEGVQGGRGQRQ